MARPKPSSWAKLKRMARYTACAPRVLYEYPWQKPQRRKSLAMRMLIGPDVAPRVRAHQEGP